MMKIRNNFILQHKRPEEYNCGIVDEDHKQYLVTKIVIAMGRVQERKDELRTFELKPSKKRN